MAMKTGGIPTNQAIPYFMMRPPAKPSQQPACRRAPSRTNSRFGASQGPNQVPRPRADAPSCGAHCREAARLPRTSCAGGALRTAELRASAVRLSRHVFCNVGPHEPQAPRSETPARHQPPQVVHRPRQRACSRRRHVCGQGSSGVHRGPEEPGGRARPSRTSCAQDRQPASEAAAPSVARLKARPERARVAADLSLRPLAFFVAARRGRTSPRRDPSPTHAARSVTPWLRRRFRTRYSSSVRPNAAALRLWASVAVRGVRSDPSR
jgi:hypothetical protein